MKNIFALTTSFLLATAPLYAETASDEATKRANCEDQWDRADKVKNTRADLPERKYYKIQSGLTVGLTKDSFMEKCMANETHE